MLKGSTPVRLSQIDMSPFVRAAKMNEAASLNLSNAVTKSISDFTKKQEEKRQKDASIESIMEMLGLDKKTATAVYNDEAVREAFKIQQKSQGDLVRKQKEQLELNILKRENELAQKNQSALEKAIAVNTTPEGTLDVSGLDSAFVEFGGTNKDLLNTFKGPGEIKINFDTGVITQDGKYKGLIASKLLNKKDDDADDGNGDPFAGTEDPIIIQFMSANPQFKTYEEAESLVDPNWLKNTRINIICPKKTK